MAVTLNRFTRFAVRIRVAACAVALLSICACGQIGPLYLPDSEASSPPDSATTDSLISPDDDDAPQAER